MNWLKRMCLVVAVVTMSFGMCFATGYSGGGYGSSSKSSSSSSRSSSSSYGSSSSRSSSSRSYSGGGYGSSSKSSSSSSKSYSGGGYGSSSSKSYGSSSSSGSSSYGSKSSGGYGSTSSKNYGSSSSSSSSGSSGSSLGGWGSSSKSYKPTRSEVPMPNTSHEVSYPSSGGSVRRTKSSDGSLVIVPIVVATSSSKPAWDDIYNTVGKSSIIYTNEAACSAALSTAIIAYNFSSNKPMPSYIPAFVSVQVPTNAVTTNMVTNSLTNLLENASTNASTNATAKVVTTNSVAWVNRPVVLVGGHWGYTNAAGVFTNIGRENLRLTTTHLKKYGYDPDYGKPMDVALKVFLIVFGCIVLVAIVAFVVIAWKNR